MAIFDVIGEFSDAQTFTTLTTTEGRASTDIINLGGADRNFGGGEPLYLNIRVNTAFTSAGTPATTISLRNSTNTTLNGSDTVVIATGAIDLTGYSAGQFVTRVSLPVNVDEEQYIGLWVQNASASYTAGNLDAWIDHGPRTDFDTQVTTSNI
jgi:hypothetical protein